MTEPAENRASAPLSPDLASPATEIPAEPGSQAREPLTVGNKAKLSAPFPWPGGKSTPAPYAWERFGEVDNLVEPFCGSIALTLAAPRMPPAVTCNDLDAFICNWWRAVTVDPEEVAHHADWPVCEIDLHARHAYLVQRTPWLVDRLMGDPNFCDPKLAGWWVWGLCSWIGSGFCSGKGPWVESGGALVHRSELEANGALPGVSRQLPHLSAGPPGIRRRLPNVGGADGRDKSRCGIRRKLPNLTAGFSGGGTGVNGALPGVSRQLPHLSAGQRVNRADRASALVEWFTELKAYLRSVRFTCGDYRRVLTPAVTIGHGMTAVFLDPEYKHGDMEYSAGSRDPALWDDLETWCRENQDNPQLRIALCGHEGDYDLPGWDVYRWKARGGYGNQGGEDKDDNRHREAIWFSPNCLSARQGRLFG